MIYRKLGEIGNFFGGLHGKNKYDFKDELNAYFVPYMNVYKNLAVDLNDLQAVHIGANEHQHSLQLGDVIFTGSSETLEECGISAVVTEPPPKNLYLNSFCFGFRLNDANLLLPDFSKHLFSAAYIRKQIVKTAQGVTRFNVSKKKMEQVEIPIPDLETQEKIAKILDKFEELTKELTKELTMRRKQFEYYRDQLLKFENVPVYRLEEICKKISSGGTPNTIRRWYYNGNIPWLRTQEVNFNEITDTAVKITEEGFKNSSAKWIPANCVILAMYGATVGRVAVNKIPLTTNQACCNLEIDEKIALYKYVFYCLENQYRYIKSLSQGTQTNINSKIVKDLLIPIPNLQTQSKITKILDKFDSICNNITAGLPYEIHLRKKQFQYYRDVLLSFEK